MKDSKKPTLGIELGSTRIKSVLIEEDGKVAAQGSFTWKNVLADGLWSYPLEDAVRGVRESYRQLADSYRAKTGEPLRELGSVGISGMMHGYIALDRDDRLLVPFRTWRNTNTAEASAELSELFDFHIPMRWSVAQYYQSVLENLPHVGKVAWLTTLAGYLHYLLTGEKVLGMDDASGMFPVDGSGYDARMMKRFNALLAQKGISVDFEALLPKPLAAGRPAGFLTPDGAKLLDPSGELQPGCLFCPPEGDMGTGMIATDSVAPRYANISSGTSANLTVVLEKPLCGNNSEIDVVATPDGNPCALIHTNNCCTEIDEWANLFREMLQRFGVEIPLGKVLDGMFEASRESDPDVGKLVGYNYLAGEPIAGVENGFPMLGRMPDGKLTLANFAQTQINSAIAGISLGTDLLKENGVRIERVLAHGGFYKNDGIGQRVTSAALGGVPVTVTETASEGGAWGMALLALYARHPEKTLPDFLAGIFDGIPTKTLSADASEIAKYNQFLERYRKYLPGERAVSEI